LGAGRKEALEAYGPHGLKNMTSHIEKAWKEGMCRFGGRGWSRLNATGYRVNVHEIQAEVVYRDANVTVTAFPLSMGYGKRLTDTRSRLTAARL